MSLYWVDNTCDLISEEARLAAVLKTRDVLNDKKNEKEERIGRTALSAARALLYHGWPHSFFSGTITKLTEGDRVATGRRTKKDSVS